jgi:hypothetical protein
MEADMKSFIWLFILAATAVAMAQPPDTLWTRTFGGSGSDLGRSVQQTSDGGYIITSSTNSYGVGPSDVWLIKTNSDGDSLWTRTFGGSSYEGGHSVQQTVDGGYIIAGYTQSYGVGGYDVWLIKTNSDGDSLWTRTFGGSNYDGSHKIQQTADGGYIITGYTRSYGAGSIDVYLVKTNSNGDSLWTRTFGGSSDDYGYSVQKTNDGGYIITGYTESYGTGGYDVWLIKTDSNGDTLWTRTFGGSQWEKGFSVQQTDDGGYIITGYTSSYGAGSYDVWLIKTNSNGDSLWTRTFGGNDYDTGSSVQQTNDEGYIIAGYTQSYGAGLTDVWIIKTDSNGDSLWTCVVGGSFYDYGNGVQQTSDGGYIITGSTNSYGAGEDDVWLIRLAGTNPILSVSPDTLTYSAVEGGANPDDQSFQIENIGTSTFDYSLSEDISWLTAAPMSGGPIPPTDTVTVSVDISGLSAGDYAGDIIVTAPGAQESPDTVHVSLHIEASGLQPLQGNEIPTQFALLPAFPNPFNPITRLTFEIPRAGKVTLNIYNVQGKKVSELYSGWCSAGIYRATFNGADLPSGIYFCRMTAGDFVQTRKMLLVK